MITIDVKTKAVTLSQDVPVMARNQFGNATYGYVRGQLPPNYQLPATIGFMHTRHGTYLFDTRTRVDGMPLFKGYTREQWIKD